MRTYIDEAGGFVVPPPSRLHSYSLILALTIPSTCESELFQQFTRLRDGWQIQEVEIKGSKLNESQAAEVIDLVRRCDVLVKFFAIDMTTHSDPIVDNFKARQAAALTAHLTPEHYPALAAQLQKDADSMRAMPNQLFLQGFLTINLVLEVIREATLYYVQRQPKELGEIAWFVDRKNHTITQMEDMWTKLILPMSENAFATEPLAALRGADYSHFDAHYGFTTATADAEMLQHLQWMQQVYGPRPTDPAETHLHARLLLSERLEFQDSRDSLGLQLADMLATILRRALNNHLQFRGWKHFGQLLVRKGQPGSPFLQLGSGPRRTIDGHAKKVCIALDARAKSMLLDQSSQ
jgi:hypothetical protein